MMEQTFEYPNLLSGTRSGKGWTYGGPAGAGGVSYDKANNYLALQGTSKSEFLLYSPIIVLHKDTDYTLHCFVAATENMSSADIWVLDTEGFTEGFPYQWIGAYLLRKNPGPEGAWLDWTFRLDANARDGGTFRVRFDNNGSTDGQNCLVWFRDIMLTEGTEPRAWAPAEGETLAGGVLS